MDAESQYIFLGSSAGDDLLLASRFFWLTEKIIVPAIPAVTVTNGPASATASVQPLSFTPSHPPAARVCNTSNFFWTDLDPADVTSDSGSDTDYVQEYEDEDTLTADDVGKRSYSVSLSLEHRISVWIDGLDLKKDPSGRLYMGSFNFTDPFGRNSSLYEFTFTQSYSTREVVVDDPEVPSYKISLIDSESFSRSVIYHNSTDGSPVIIGGINWRRKTIDGSSGSPPDCPPTPLPSVEYYSITP